MFFSQQEYYWLFFIYFLGLHLICSATCGDAIDSEAIVAFWC